MVSVDVDDTLIRSFGSKRMPMNSTVALVRELKQHGVALYCWSSGGADYARLSAEEVGLGDCFITYLPKPHAMLDDVNVERWNMLQLHPAECTSLTADELVSRLQR